MAYLAAIGKDSPQEKPDLKPQRSRSKWSFSTDSPLRLAHVPKAAVGKPITWKPEPDSEPLLLHLLSAHNLPKHDVFSESDPFCTIDLLPFVGASEALLSVAWPVKWDTASPVWNSCRLLGEAARSESGLRLRLTFYDYDIDLGYRTKELMGIAEVNVSALEVGAPPSELRITTVKEWRDGLPATVRLQRLPSMDLPQRKTIYIVRHGESVWCVRATCHNEDATLPTACALTLSCRRSMLRSPWPSTHPLAGTRRRRPRTWAPCWATPTTRSTR